MADVGRWDDITSSSRSNSEGTVSFSSPVYGLRSAKVVHYLFLCLACTGNLAQTETSGVRQRLAPRLQRHMPPAASTVITMTVRQHSGRQPPDIPAHARVESSTASSDDLFSRATVI
jgi:hypothetical protein